MKKKPRSVRFDELVEGMEPYNKRKGNTQLPSPSQDKEEQRNNPDKSPQMRANLMYKNSRFSKRNLQLKPE